MSTIGSTQFCGHGVMAVLCPKCNAPKPAPMNPLDETPAPAMTTIKQSIIAELQHQARTCKLNDLRVCVLNGEKYVVINGNVDLEALCAAVAAPPSGNPGERVVACRVLRGGEDGTYTGLYHTRSEAEVWLKAWRRDFKHNPEIEPLYAAPPQPAPDALREEAIEEVAQRIFAQMDPAARKGRHEIQRMIRALSSAPVQSGVRGDREAMREALESLADWCSTERAKLGAVDGYDYHSGEEYGLRCAEIEIGKRILSLQSTGDQRTPQVSGDGSR